MVCSADAVLNRRRKAPTKMRQAPSIKEVLSYKNSAVTDRYQKKLALSPGEANQLFEDVLRFLWVKSVTKEPITPSQKIDDGWHNFILFTKDYANFCSRYFGKFIHHTPKTIGKEIGATPAKRVAKKLFAKLSSNWNKSPADCDACN